MSAANKLIKLGIIGGGVNSSIGWAHVSAAQMDGKFKVEGGCFSREITNSLKTAEIWNLDPQRVYQSVDSLIKNENNRLDAIAILTPTPNHLESFNKLTMAKLPIICEKPLATSSKDAILMKEMSAKNNNLTAVTFNYSGYPMIRELKEIIACGEIGEIIHVQMEMPQEFFLKLDPISGQLTKPRGWRLKDEFIPTICLDLGVHLHHLCCFLTELKIKSVNATMSKSIIHPEIIDDVMMWLKFENDAQGSFWFSKSALGHRNGLKIRVYGTKGSAVWKHKTPEVVSISLNNGEIQILDRGGKTKIAGQDRYNRYRAGHPSGFIEAFCNVYNDIGEAINRHKKGLAFDNRYIYGIDHSIEGLQLFERAVESNNSKVWKKL